MLLLKPDFGLDELIILIRFLYKTKYGQNNIQWGLGPIPNPHYIFYNAFSKIN